ncbi:MAG: hypothetical protein ACHP7N_15520 [Caulobacterales bacterium]
MKTPPSVAALLLGAMCLAMIPLALTARGAAPIVLFGAAIFLAGAVFSARKAMRKPDA